MSIATLQLIKRHPLTAFYGITFALSWITLLAAYLFFKNNMSAQWLAVLFPALTALVLTGLLQGKPGLEQLIKSLFRWRVGWHWYLVIILLPIFWTLATVVLYQWLGDRSQGEQNTNWLAWLQTFPGSLPVLLGLSLMFSVLSAGEEIGWRGFAQPLLQSRLGWFKGTLVVGLFWGLWHIGAALDPGNVLNRAPLYLSIPLFVLGTIEYSFIYTWLWEKTKGSLLIICFFHGFYDIFNTYASQFFPYVISQYWLQLIAIAFIILWIYGKRFRKLNDETLRQGL